MLRAFLTRLKQGSEPLNFGREIITGWVAEHARGRSRLTILDLGMGNGRDLRNAREAAAGADVRLLGVDLRGDAVARAADSGIEPLALDLESEPLPLPDASVDVVIANQVLEHTKEIFWILAELSRVLRPGGLALVGVPNLASFHNRVALALGEQPTCIELFGPHVRGFTGPSFTRLVQRGGVFAVTGFRGSNFYPFPPAVSGVLSRALPSLSVGIFFRLQRTDRAATFLEALDDTAGLAETPFRGL